MPKKISEQTMNTASTKTSHPFKMIRTMKRMSIIILFALVSVSACTKNKTTIIEGHVLEYGTDKPIEGAKVPILIGFLTGPIQGGYETIGTATTDASGHFKWESDEDILNDWYAIGKISADKYFTLDWNASGDYHTSIEYRDHYNKTMHLDPHAYLHLHVEDVPEVESEFCKIFGSLKTVKVELGKNGFLPIQTVKGNKEIEIYRKFDNVPGSAIKDSIVIPAHDTLLYYIKY